MAKWLPERADDPLDPEVVANLRSLGNGSDDFLREVFTLFREDLPPRIRAMRDALDQHNPAALASAAHAVKSSAGNVGAVAVRQIAGELEALGMACTIEGAGAIVEKLAAAVTRVFDRMTEIADGGAV
jgi:HPt (histidine-containing phosphotransfer) domain-containing protein